MKTIAIMQPYCFPYIGYFQLINAADVFIFYDDVNFIKQGWINRNRVLMNNSDLLFTIPLKNISSNNLINQTEISRDEYDKWLKKFLRTITVSYKKAPFFKETIEIIEKTFILSKTRLISELAILSIKNVCDYLNIKKIFKISSKEFSDSAYLHKAERLIEICKTTKAGNYINLIGGKKLYSKDCFYKNGINLYFLQSKNINYKQFNNNFVPWLSIIDIMMFNNVQTVNKMLNDYELQ